MATNKAVILLNDDDPVFTRVARAKFQHETGWDSVITNDYNEAIEAFHETEPDILITDIILKDEESRTGFDLIAEIRDESANTVIVVLTELRQDRDEIKAKKLGADHYYVKSSISLKDLISELQRILEQQ